MNIILWTNSEDHKSNFSDSVTVEDCLLGSGLNEPTVHWEAVETYQEAKLLYEKLLTKKSTYSVSICNAIRSTEPHYIKDRNIFKNIMSFCTQGFPRDGEVE